MIQDIKYAGYSANPSDYEVADGELSLSLNMIQENGSLRPVMQPKQLMVLGEGETVKYIHKDNYIILDSDNVVSWRTLTSGSITTLKDFGTEVIYQITSIGNTLMVLASDGIHYFLLKQSITVNQEKFYKYLGTTIPECPISFGLRGEMVRSSTYTITYDRINIDTGKYYMFSESNKSRITEQVLAKVNKFIADESTRKGKFIYPFFIRYAYRLYDGTLTKHSAPILMIASSEISPEVFADIKPVQNQITFSDSADITIAAMTHTIDYAVKDQSTLQNIKDWKDIIQSVDIFVSRPIYTYDQNGECTQFKSAADNSTFCVCKHTNQAVSTLDYPNKYQYSSFKRLYAFTFYPETLEYPKDTLVIPRKSDDQIKKDIEDNGQFYLLRSLNTEELKTSRTKIEVEDTYLETLLVKELMTDDYDSHDQVLAKYAYIYNSRLNIAQLSKKTFTGFDATALFNYTDGFVAYEESDGEILSYTDIGTESVYSYVYLNKDGRTIIVEGGAGVFGKQNPLLFFYHPDPNAYKAIIARGSTKYEINLERHAFLNGAFYFGGWENISKTTTITPDASSAEERTIEIPNKIYTSEVNNPFLFPVSGIYTVGAGKVLGICSTTKALSEGQFGQFPLYAFTNDGIWAMEVSTTGTYSSIQPVSRDVCINIKSITQADNAILFATERGITLLSGSQTVCISDILFSPEIFTVSNLPHPEVVINQLNIASDGIELEDINLIPFDEFIQDCSMTYDYIHQRVIVFNPDVKYAYLYSFKSKAWGMISASIENSVNSFSNALVVANIKLDTLNGTFIVPALTDLSQDSEKKLPGLIITRPFKFGDSNTLKTISTIIQRGQFDKDHITQILYGSNDLYHWHIVASSKDKYLRGFRGTPYKSYRLALICNFNKQESIHSFTAQFTPRLTNQPR